MKGQTWVRCFETRFTLLAVMKLVNLFFTGRNSCFSTEPKTLVTLAVHALTKLAFLSLRLKPLFSRCYVTPVSLYSLSRNSFLCVIRYRETFSCVSLYCETPFFFALHATIKLFPPGSSWTVIYHEVKIDVRCFLNIESNFWKKVDLLVFQW